MGRAWARIDTVGGRPVFDGSVVSGRGVKGGARRDRRDRRTVASAAIKTIATEAVLPQDLARTTPLRTRSRAALPADATSWTI